MKQLVINNLTGEVIEIEVDETVEVIQQPVQPSTLEQRVENIEQEQGVIISVLTDITGV